MSLKNLFEIAKKDWYTADGREELNKALETEVEDRVYKIGEISQKTGLMKTANGWVKPKTGNAGSAKKEEDITSVNGNLSERAKFAYENQAKKLSTEGLESVIRNKDKVFAKHNDEIAEIYKKELESRKNKPSETPKASNPESKEALDKAWDFIKSQHIHDIVSGPFKSIMIKAGSADKAKRIGKELEADYNYKLYGEYDRRYVYIPINRDTLFPDESPEETAKIKRMFSTHDSAPHVLTGDCKIRVRK